MIAREQLKPATIIITEYILGAPGRSMKYRGVPGDSRLHARGQGWGPGAPGTPVDHRGVYLSFFSQFPPIFLPQHA